MKYIVLLFLVGCAPIQTYEEISDEAEITGDNTKLEKFEAIAKKAYEFRENKAHCMLSDEHVWLCSDAPMRNRKDAETVDEIVRHYRRYHHYCGCARRDDLWRNLGI